MRKLFTILVAVLLIASVFLPRQASAQAPQKMSYQAVIRNASNNLVASHAVGMKITILKNATAVYTETQTPTTNANGLVSIEIGSGTGFSDINWAAGTYFIQTETDPTGGTNYTITGTSQLLSVPFAMHAKTAENFTGTIAETDPVFVAWDKDYSDLINAPATITPAQANAITANTAKVGYTDALVSANADVVANTAKVGITPAQTSAIAANTLKVSYTDAAAVALNTAKTGITTTQANAITDNTTAIGTEKTRAEAAEATLTTAVSMNSSDISTLKTEQTTQNTAIALNTAKAGITVAQATAITDNTTAIATETGRATGFEATLTTAIGVNTTDISTLKTEQTAQNSAIALNTAKAGITVAQATAITDNATSIATETGRATGAEATLSTAVGVNTTAIATNATAIATETGRATGAEATLTTSVGVNTTAIATNATAIATETGRATGVEATLNTAIGVNTSDISTIKTEQTSQNSAIALNTAKAGITAGQASAIVANTAKVGYTDALVSANSDVAANTLKVGYTDALVSANSDVAANTLKTGITTAQASEIAANTLKVGYTDALVSANSDVAANTLKVGYTEALVSANTAVAANTLKVGITTAQSDAIVANTAKVGITTAQVTAIADNTTAIANKVDKISGKGLSTSDFSAADKTKLDGLQNADGSETKVTAGTNITVTGAGTTASPYFVNATSGGALIADMKLSARAADHNGWLVCDGRLVSTTTYATLFAIVGYGYGGAGATFKLPDLRGRVAGGIGQGTSLTNRVIGVNVGAETHTLTINEMPSHSHNVYDPGHQHSIRGSFDFSGGGSVIGAYAPGSNSGLDRYNSTTTDYTGISLNNSGNGSAHNNMQPTQFVGNYFIYAGL